MLANSFGDGSMKREKIKTLLLVFLFVISIFLTQQLWIEFPYEALSSLVDSSQLTKVELSASNIISPEKFLINFSESKRTLLYSDNNHFLWPKGKDILKEGLKNEDMSVVKITDEEYENEKKRKSITYIFPQNTYTYALAKGLDVKISQKIHGVINKVDDISIYLGRDPYIIINSDDNYFKITGTQTDYFELRNTIDSIEGEGYTRYYTIKESIGIDSDIFMSLSLDIQLPYVYVDREINTKDEDALDKIAENILDKDIDYIRKFVENNGSIIYMHDQKTLKIYNNGLLEYFDIINEPITKRDPYLSLDTAIKFVFKCHDKAKDIRLSNIEEIVKEGNKGYRILFTQTINGFPVVGLGGELSNFIEVEVFNEYVKSSKMYIRDEKSLVKGDIGDNKPMLASYDILNKNINLIQENYIKNREVDITKAGERERLREEVLTAIDDIYLAYYDPALKDNREMILPVWVIKIGNLSYLFDAYSGQMIYKEK